jgi:hypothetical protein
VNNDYAAMALGKRLVGRHTVYLGRVGKSQKRKILSAAPPCTCLGARRCALLETSVGSSAEYEHVMDPKDPTTNFDLRAKRAAGDA